MDMLIKWTPEKNSISKSFHNVCVAGIFLLFGNLFFSQSFAGAYQLWEEDANLDPAGAAGAFNAADEFYNPAGMVRMKRPQLSVGLAYLPYSVTFTGLVDVINPMPQFSGKMNDLVGINNAFGGTNSFVPNLHYVTPLQNNWFFGIGITSPFGLSTDYSQQVPANAAVGIAATQTELATVNINPSLAYAFNQHLSLGVGLDAMWAREIYNADLIPLPPLLPAGSLITNGLIGWGYGYNAGILLQYPTWRVGISYRSAIKITGFGSSSLGTIAGVPTPDFFSTNHELTSSTTLPATTWLSFYQELNATWAWMGTAAYTQWSAASQFELNNLALAQLLAVPTANIVLNYAYKNTWTMMLGAHYRISRQMLLRMGLNFDPTPTTDGHRDIRLPDSNRLGLMVGTHLQASENLCLDFAWRHLFAQNANINNSNITGNEGIEALLIALQTGTVQSSADVFGVQVSWSFGDGR